MLISEPDVVMDLVAELLPPVPVPPLESLLAPVITVTVDAPAIVGVPEIGQLMLAPATTVAGVAGEQVPAVTPAGRPEMAQLAMVAVAEAAFVHKMVPV